MFANDYSLDILSTLLNMMRILFVRAESRINKNEDCNTYIKLIFKIKDLR
jgi:hypothetical protein